LEKPDPASTPSRKACPCFYLYRRSVLPLITQYVANAKTLPELDAPGTGPLALLRSIACSASLDFVSLRAGTLVQWLYPRTPIYAYPITGRFDIGGLDSYIEADTFFHNKLKTAPSAASASAAAAPAAEAKNSAAPAASKPSNSPAAASAYTSPAPAK
jgi:hypothetical protein